MMTGAVRLPRPTSKPFSTTSKLRPMTFKHSPTTSLLTCSVLRMLSGNVTALADVAKSYIGGLDLHFYNAVVSGVAPYTATVNLIGGVYDDGDGANPNPMVRANGCAGEFAAPILNGVLLASRGHANIYKPTVLSAGEVQVYDYGDGNETSAWVMGGSNDGNVNSTATGQFYVHNLW